MKATSIALLSILATTVPAYSQQTDGTMKQVDGPSTVIPEDQAMKIIADMICDQNPYTLQTNNVTGEKTGPMQLIPNQLAAQVLANGYSKEWTIGGRTYFIKKVVALPYQFDTSRNGQATGKRVENILILYAGEQGGG